MFFSSRPLMRSIALILAVTQLVGCYKWKPTLLAPEALVQGGSPERLRVTLHDGSEVTLNKPIIVGDSLLGTYGETGRLRRNGVALNQIVVVEVGTLDKAQTGLWVAWSVLTAVFVVYCAASDDYYCRY